MCFYGGHSTGYKLGNHPKNIEPCAHRARTVRALCAHRATTPPWDPMCPGRAGEGGLLEFSSQQQGASPQAPSPPSPSASGQVKSSVLGAFLRDSKKIFLGTRSTH